MTMNDLFNEFEDTSEDTLESTSEGSEESTSEDTEESGRKRRKLPKFVMVLNVFAIIIIIILLIIDLRANKTASDKPSQPETATEASDTAETEVATSEASEPTETEIATTEASGTAETEVATSKASEPAEPEVTELEPAEVTAETVEVIAFHNNKEIPLIVWNARDREQIISAPTMLNWVYDPCTTLRLDIYSSAPIASVYLVNTNFERIKRLPLVCEEDIEGFHSEILFEMLSELAGTLHTKKDDPTYVENADFYFEIVSTTGVVQYTSARY